jgi:uncharacterized protein YukE
MTEMAGLRAESRALIEFGRERYEDSVVYLAIGRYLADVGAIPAQAWGTLPISEQTRREWTEALDNRLIESRTAHDEMTRVADALMQIATNYEHTDLAIATTFDEINKDLQPYVSVTDGYTGEITTRTGGVGIRDTTGNHRPGYRADVLIPPDNTRLAATRHEVLPSVRVEDAKYITLGSSDGNDLTLAGGKTTYYENGEGDAFDTFLQQYKDTLLQLEAFIQEIMTGHRLPLTDLIIHAWRSSPKVIRNRADLIHSAANTYAELRGQHDNEVKRLGLYWEGTAAGAFTDHATTTSTYLAAIEAEARWLAEEGKKAASLLEGLRNAYATIGYDRIGVLLKAMDDYRTRLQGLFSPCDGAEKDS